MSFVNNQIKLSEMRSLICAFVQVAKFPFEEVPASKQGAKQESCPSSGVPTSAPSAPGSAAVSDTDTKTGQFIDNMKKNCSSRLPL